MKVGWVQGAVREDFLEAAAGGWMGRGSMSSVGGEHWDRDAQSSRLGTNSEDCKWRGVTSCPWPRAPLCTWQDQGTGLNPGRKGPWG